MSADSSSSISSSSTSCSSLPSPPRIARSNPYNLNSPRVPFRDSTHQRASPPPKAEPKPLVTMQTDSQQARRPDTTSPTESKQRFRVPSSSNAFSTIRSTLVALSDATAPAPRSKSKPRPKDSTEEEDELSVAYGFVETPSLLYDIYSGSPPSYEEVCFASNGSNHLQRQDIPSTADTIRSIARKVRKELVNGGR